MKQLDKDQDYWQARTEAAERATHTLGEELAAAIYGKQEAEATLARVREKLSAVENDALGRHQLYEIIYEAQAILAGEGKETREPYSQEDAQRQMYPTAKELATLARVREWRDAKRKRGFKYSALDRILGEGER